MEFIRAFGDTPQARFGHTVTQVSKNKVVLFGGATGDAGKFSITNETFVLDVLGRKWKKLEPKGTAPSQRAAHAATSVDALQMVIYGGATGGGKGLQ